MVSVHIYEKYCKAVGVFFNLLNRDSDVDINIIKIMDQRLVISEMDNTPSIEIV